MLRIVSLILSAALLAAPATGQMAQERMDWNRKIPPFRIAGNLYYVGTEGIGVYLLTDPAGHILLDGGLPESAPIVAENIRALGFRIEDVRYILNTHAHFDHAGGVAELKRLSGAAFAASEGDRPVLEKGRVDYRESPSFSPIKVDRTVKDGDEVRVGRAAMIARVTPGHTKGCTSWTTHVEEGGRDLAVFFSCSLTVAGQDLVTSRGYPQAARDFRRSFARIRAIKADVFLSNHGQMFKLDEKRVRLGRTSSNPFVDPTELSSYVDASEAAFDQELARQRAEHKAQ